MTRHCLLYVILIIVAVLVVGAGIGYALLSQGALSADRPPSRLETAIARRLVYLSIPRSQRGTENPYASDSAAWERAADRFANHCAVCHGSDGRGRSEVGPRMYPPVPGFADPFVQRLSDGALFAIIQHGVRWTGMPAFRSVHTPEDTWKLVSFVRHVAQLGHDGMSQGHQSEKSVSGAAELVTIVMEGTSIQPDDVTVKAGEMVEWINKDPFPHNVTFLGAHSAGSGDLEPGAHWDYRPMTPGDYAYVCTLHPGMRGMLHVKQP
jgi:plastocyanin